MSAAAALSLRGGGSTPHASTLLATAMTTPTPLTLSKEYIYAGGRLVATEEPTPAPTATPTPSLCAPSGVVISEFRFYGPNDALDEFVELYNSANVPVTVCTGDGTGGWTLSAIQTGQWRQPFGDAQPPVDGSIDSGDDMVSGGPPPTMSTTSILIPTGVTIPPHGHYLLTNAGDASNGVPGYSLGAYAAGDQTYQGDIASGAGLALFATADTTHFTTAYLLDAVGFSGAPSPYYEGTALSPSGGMTSAGEYSCVRQLASGTPQDTNNNASDFVFVSTNGGTYNGVASVLGAPGPENLSSPVNRTAQLKATLIDPCQSSSFSPNRERYSSSYTDPAAPTGSGTGTYPNGTITIRRRFTNLTGASVTRLRFRIVDITAGPAPVGTADLRAITSQNMTVTVTPGCAGSGNVSVVGTKLEAPPAQGLGGGFNSTYSVGVISLNTPLAPTNAINVQFTLGVAQTGSFRFFVLVEALP
jgi:hypothetical protein